MNVITKIVWKYLVENITNLTAKWISKHNDENLGRLEVKALSGLKRMKIVSEYIPQNLPKIWNAKAGPVCIQKLPPTSQIKPNP